MGRESGFGENVEKPRNAVEVLHMYMSAFIYYIYKRHVAVVIKVREVCLVI